MEEFFTLNIVNFGDVCPRCICFFCLFVFLEIQSVMINW